MSEENELDVSNKGSDLPDYEDENSKSPKKDLKVDPLVRIKQENVKDSEEEEEDFDSELEEEEEIDTASEDSEFDDEAESEEEEEDENGKSIFLFAKELKHNL